MRVAGTNSQGWRSSLGTDIEPSLGVLRCLNTLDVAGVKAVSSRTLAEQFHLNAAQIRKDLACFGEFGVRGVGYSVRDLKRHLRVILGLDRGVRVAIVGAGNLGLALPTTQASGRKGSRSSPYSISSE